MCACSEAPCRHAVLCWELEVCIGLQDIHNKCPHLVKVELLYPLPEEEQAYQSSSVSKLLLCTSHWTSHSQDSTSCRRHVFCIIPQEKKRRRGWTSKAVLQVSAWDFWGMVTDCALPKKKKLGNIFLRPKELRKINPRRNSALIINQKQMDPLPYFTCNSVIMLSLTSLTRHINLFAVKNHHQAFPWVQWLLCTVRN